VLFRSYEIIFSTFPIIIDS